MQVRELMSRDVRMIPAEATVRQAAATMAGVDIGSLPVWDGEQVIGMVTDRDITVRATADGREPDSATVREIMTPRVLFCYEDEDLEQASAAMAEWKVRRLAVFNRQDHLVGMLALADLATEGPPDEAAEALEGVSEPGP